MIEYLNYSGLAVLSFFFMLYMFIHITTKAKSYILHYLFGIGFILLIYDGYDQYSTSKINLKQFKRAGTLKCHVGGGVYSNVITYEVSVKNGWHLKDNYFVKDSLVVGANRCEIW